MTNDILLFYIIGIGFIDLWLFCLFVIFLVFYNTIEEKNIRYKKIISFLQYLNGYITSMQNIINQRNANKQFYNSLDHELFKKLEEVKKQLDELKNKL